MSSRNRCVIPGQRFLDTDTFQAYNKILDDTRLKLTDTGEAAARAQAELAATQAAEKQSAALKNLLGSIDPTIRAFNSLDEQHAQLVAHFEAGRINGAQFEHFNTILNQTRERLSGVADVLPEALSRQEAAARRWNLRWPVQRSNAHASGAVHRYRHAAGWRAVAVPDPAPAGRAD
jgi:hypothetical protein